MHRSRNFINGAALAAGLAVLAACGGPGRPPANVTFNVTIAGSRMIPDRLTAHQNDNVTLTITADRAEEIHLHGYDYKCELRRDQDQARSFKQPQSFRADKTGAFEIEIENSGTHLGEMDVLP